MFYALSTTNILQIGRPLTSDFVTCDSVRCPNPNPNPNPKTREAVMASMSLLVLLNDETSASRWCRYLSLISLSLLITVALARAEWECARDNHVPIICIVNQEKFHVRPIVAQYIKDGFDYLFASQGELSAFSFVDHPTLDSGALFFSTPKTLQCDHRKSHN